MPTFTQKHHSSVAKMLGVCDLPDETIQALTIKFGLFFSGDNPYFNFRRFQSLVARTREGTPLKERK